MKTKYFLIAIVVVLGAMFNVISVKAQETQQKEDKVTLKIRLQPIQTIVVTPGQKTVEFLYASTGNYSTGATESKADHLTVFSTGGFEVKVQAKGDFTREGTGGGSIPVSDVTVSAIAGAGDKNVGAFSQVTLSTAAGSLITADKGGRDMKYTVTYDNTAGGGDKYIDKYIASDMTESVYTTEVTYTIAAK